MKLLTLLTSSVAVLCAHAAFAGEPLFPQPIDVAATVGTEQSDFFLLRYAKGTKLVFSALTKEVAATQTKPTQDMRTLFAQNIESLGAVNTYFAVDKSAPLAKLTTFTLPTGTVFDTFLYNGNSVNTQVMQGLPQEFFHVPTKGIYVSTGGSTPAVVRAETAAAPTMGFAMQNVNFTANDTDHTEAFRLVLGAKDTKNGYEPFVSQGKGAAVAMTVQGTTTLIPNATSFTTFIDPDSTGTTKNVVYFLGDGAAGGTFVYKTTVDTSHPTAKYGAVQVTAASLPFPADLTGSNDGLMCSADISGTRQLLLSSDGTDSFATVSGAGTNPTNFVPNIVTGLNGMGDSNLAGTGFIASDSTHHRRFQILANVAGASAYYTDSSGLLTDPEDIISTGSFFFYSASDSGDRFAVMDSNAGSQDSEYFMDDGHGNYLINPQEFTFIHGFDISGLDGTVYFTAQINGDSSNTRYLFKTPANDTSAYNSQTGTISATTVLTVASQADKNNAGATATVPITSAHNLRNVSDNAVFRLYFCAPITDTENSQWRPTLKVGKVTGPTAVGTKPWVLSDQ